MSKGAGPIDLSLRVKDPGEAVRLAQCALPSHVRSFLSRWAGAEASLAPVHSIWLEFDLDREPEGLPTPVVCAKLLPDASPANPAPANTAWLTGSLLPTLQGKPLGPGRRELIEHCHRAIPEPAYLLYAFSLLARGSDAVRLEIFGLDPAGILSYLERVAPEAIPWVEREATLFEDVERIHLSVDLGEEVVPRIGIEGSFSRLPQREPRWGELFDRLVSRGLCDPGKRDAALGWTGSEIFQGGFCFRKPSHVKVVCRPGREPEAKAYLLFGYLSA